MIDIATYAGVMLLTGFLALAFVAGKPWTFLGLKVWVAKIKFKANAGLLVLTNKAGDFNRIFPIDLSADRYTQKQGKNKEPKDYTYSKEQIQNGRLLGLPFVILNEDDTKTSIGLYYQQSGPDGEPLFINVNGDQVPYVTAIKPSVSLSPSYFKALVGDHTLTMALKDFLQKNKQILIAAGIGVIAAAAAAFFAFEITSTHVPIIVDLLRGIDGKVTEILGILRAL